MKILTDETMVRWWGDRCPEYSEGCAVCDAWSDYDAMPPASIHTLVEHLLDSASALERAAHTLQEVAEKEVTR